ncbi:MAG TPA: DUF2849 domain-containing protein [Alphaproteobacteria bacterium]|nr:DUF2849 domain-containing protein [Alphaproteobacteria bacterium]
MDILAGNELLSGGAVYFSRHGRWIDDLQQARLFGKDEIEARDAVIAASKATGRIVGIEIESASLVDGRIVPDRMRERIRAGGPTTPRFDRQRVGEDGHVSI